MIMNISTHEFIVGEAIKFYPVHDLVILGI
jgi:hypothetical protein